MDKTRIINQEGTIAVLSALSLPIFICLLGLVVDGGRYLSHSAKLASIADMSANAGISKAGDLIGEKLEQLNDELDLDTISTDMFTQSDWDEIESSVEPEEMALQFIENNNTDELILTNTSIIYPYSSNSEALTLQVQLTTDFYTNFPLVLLNDRITIDTTSIASIQK